jgi:hypothetical protein
LFFAGVSLWGFLLSVIAWPESRWGAENSRLIGEALQPIAYGLVVVLVSFVLALLAKGSAVLYSLLMSLGTLVYFGVMTWLANSLPLVMAHARSLEILFFVLLLPLATILWGRVGWLTRRSTGSR